MLYGHLFTPAVLNQWKYIYIYTHTFGLGNGSVIEVSIYQFYILLQHDNSSIVPTRSFSIGSSQWEANILQTQSSRAHALP